MHDGGFHQSMKERPNREVTARAPAEREVVVTTSASQPA
jgi:hypothetical protein